MLTKIFPPKTFTVSEMNEIAMHLTNPAVKKYLEHLAIQNFAGIAGGLPAKGETPQDYLIRQATVVGANNAIEQLLSIEEAKLPPSSPSRS